jgi:hypothetical protein
LIAAHTAAPPSCTAHTRATRPHLTAAHTATHICHLLHIHDGERTPGCVYVSRQGRVDSGEGKATGCAAYNNDNEMTRPVLLPKHPRGDTGLTVCVQTGIEREGKGMGAREGEGARRWLTCVFLKGTSDHHRSGTCCAHPLASISQSSLEHHCSSCLMQQALVATPLIAATPLLQLLLKVTL